MNKNKGKKGIVKRTRKGRVTAMGAIDNPANLRVGGRTCYVCDKATMHAVTTPSGMRCVTCIPDLGWSQRMKPDGD